MRRHGDHNLLKTLLFKRHSSDAPSPSPARRRSAHLCSVDGEAPARKDRRTERGARRIGKTEIEWIGRGREDLDHNVPC